MRRLSLGSISLAAFIMAAGMQAAPAQSIKIGVFGPLTGDAAAMGSSEKEAVELAVKEKNDAGGIRGKKIEVIYGDDAGKPEEAVNVAKRLISRDEALITVGSISSPASLAASQISRQSETAQIVVSGTAQRITTQGNKWVFRSPVPDTKVRQDMSPQTALKDKPDDSYIVGIADELQISVWKEPDLSGPVVVRPDGMITLRQDGWRRVLGARTTVEEVIRVTQADEAISETD